MDTEATQLEDVDSYKQMEQLEYEEGVLMAAADYNIFMASELEDEPPATDPDDGAADDSHLWEYADRTEKTGLSPDGAVLRAGSTLDKIW